MIARRGPLSSRRRVVATLARRSADRAAAELPSAEVHREVREFVRGPDFWQATHEREDAPVARGVSRARRFFLRVLFAFDVIGAGGPGVLMLVAPEKANEWLFAGGLTPDAGTAVLGCVWVSLGLLSLAGLLRPVTFSPVLLVQLGYKLVWLCAVAAPAALRGEAVPPVLAAIAAGWVIVVALAVQWGALFGKEAERRKISPLRLEPASAAGAGRPLERIAR